MTFISYAQNAEDVLLNRAFGAVNDGRYIDIGAGDPEFDSVTKAFYDRGWTGVNVEPSPHFFSRLAEQRERDTNLQVAVAAEPGTISYFSVEGYEELSTVMPALASDYRDNGREVVEQVVPAVTLADISSSYAGEVTHFLKIDIEGGELDALRGADFSAFRPWIVLVEAVTFGDDSADQTTWEDLLIAANYRFAYFDGLNRYYVAEEHAELLAHFVTPVNVRDQYVRPLESRAQLILGRIADTFGIENYSDEHEVFERAHVLLDDRIAYESKAIKLAERLEKQGAKLEKTRQSLLRATTELEAYWQQSFERERHIAWLAAETQRLKGLIAEARDERDAANQRVADIFRTGSWRLSLPLRVARRPAPYVRKLLGR